MLMKVVDDAELSMYQSSRHLSLDDSKKAVMCCQMHQHQLHLDHINSRKHNLLMHLRFLVVVPVDDNVNLG